MWIYTLMEEGCALMISLVFAASLVCLQSWTGLKVVLVGLKATKNFAVFLVGPPLARKLGRLVVRQATKLEVRDRA